MKSQILLTLILSLFSVGVFGQSYSTTFATNIGGSLEDECTGLATDAKGNIYLAGKFENKAYLGNDSVISAGDEDILIVKFDASGNIQWKLAAGDTSSDEVYDIEVDGNGNVYFTGSFENDITFGSTTLTSAGSDDVFVVKLDSNANVEWAFQGGGSDSEVAFDLSVSSSGDVFVTGSLGSANAMFGSNLLVAVGDDDIFAIRLDANGFVTWAASYGSLDDEVGNSIAVNSSGEFYLTGSIENQLTIGSFNLTNSAGANFIVKYDASANIQWVKVLDGIYLEEEGHMSVDGSGNIYLTGAFSDTMVVGSTTLISAGGTDAFVVKLDANGNFKWAVSAGGSGDDIAMAVTATSTSVYVAGSFRQTATFGSTTKTSAGGEDNFMMWLDGSGNIEGAVSSGGSSSDKATSIAMSNSGSIVVGGSFEGSGTFKTSSTTLSSNGGEDMYVWYMQPGTGLNSHESNDNAYVYPNPAANTVYFDGINTEKALVEVYGINGALILQTELTNPGQGLDIDRLESGSYLIRLKQKDKIRSFHIIKQ